MINISSSLNWLLIVLIVVGVSVSIVPSQAEDKATELQEPVVTISKHLESAPSPIGDAVSRQYTTSKKSSTYQSKLKENARITSKTKTKNYILLSVFTAGILFMLINIISLSSNSRYCSNCGYAGHMKLVAVANTSHGQIIVFLVKLLPVLLYYYSKRGRFCCPRCQRTSTNTAI
jgi:hypothetical protein